MVRNRKLRKKERLGEERKNVNMNTVHILPFCEAQV